MGDIQVHSLLQEAKTGVKCAVVFWDRFSGQHKRQWMPYDKHRPSDSPLRLDQYDLDLITRACAASSGEADNLAVQVADAFFVAVEVNGDGGAVETVGEIERWLCGQEEGFDDGVDLVLTGLARHHHGDDPAQVVVDAVQDGVGNFGLVGVEWSADDVNGEAFDGGHGLIVHGTMIALREKR